MQNPKRQKLEEDVVTAESNWSKLCRDVLQMVLERLGSTDFDRAKAVCSRWRSASRESVRKPNGIPWLILFPYERSYGNSCRLLNPGEKGLVYRSRNLGVEFTQSRCIATCGSWLLMYVHHQRKLYILNPLTRERINLPPLESRKKDSSDDEEGGFYLSSEREKALTDEIGNLSSSGTKKAVFWIDERSKDYFVLWSHWRGRLFFSKKGNDCWRSFPNVKTGWKDFVCKGQKLYIFTLSLFVEIYDFSGDSPLVVPPSPYAYFPTKKFLFQNPDTRIAVTTSGEVLLVNCYKTCDFYVFKMNHVTRKWEEIATLGEEALIFDLGITTHVEGIKADSIYFSGLGFGTNHIFIFNLATSKVEPFLSPTRKFFDARWFIPM